MYDLKTKPDDSSVIDFIGSVAHKKRQEDALGIQLMTEITGEKPVMWGKSIIGFSSYHYQYAIGHEGDWLRIGFSPGKANITFYIMKGFSKYDLLLKKLGKYKTGKSCLYINKLEDIDIDVLKDMIQRSYNDSCMGEKEKDV